MDHVIAEDQRNAEPALLHGHFLQVPGKRSGMTVEERAATSRTDILFVSFADRRPGRSPVGRIERHLADLLLERHEGQDAVDLAVILSFFQGWPAD